MKSAWLGKGVVIAPHCASCLAHSIISWNLNGYEQSQVGGPLSSPELTTSLRLFRMESSNSAPSGDASCSSGAKQPGCWTWHMHAGSGVWGKQFQQWCSSTMSWLRACLFSWVWTNKISWLPFDHITHQSSNAHCERGNCRCASEILLVRTRWIQGWQRKGK